MSSLLVKIVVRTIQSRGNYGEKSSAVLAVIGRAHFHARDLGHRIRFAGLFQGTRHQIFFTHWLRTVSRIYAVAAEEYEPLNPGLESGMKHICLNGKVGANEIRWIGGVGLDASHFCRRQEYVLRLLFFEKGLHL